MKKILSLFLILFSFFIFFGIAFADDSKCANPSSLGLDDINTCINDLTQAEQSSVNATTPLISEVAGIKNRIAVISNDLVVKKQNIDEGYANLAKETKVLNAAIRDYYIQSYYNSPLTILLSSSTATDIAQILTYQKTITDQDKLIITNMALTIQSLQQQQAELQTEQTSLASAKLSLDKVISQAQAYQATLSTQISALSAVQQQILSQRLASLNIPLTAYTTQGGCSSDLTNGKDPGFSNAFGFFTYGVPNRVGLNQYGAKARAEAGQSYQQILNAYYQNISFTNVDPNTQITVNGTNEYGETFSNQAMNLDDYVKHLYEMPTSWSMQALEAQAIAARSYAMATTNNGANPICPSQSCQVVKTEINDSNWQSAVDATKGIIMTDGGAPIKAWFSSTHGGYVFSSADIGWSGTDYTKDAQDTTGNVGSFADLQNNSYDKASPWFYCDWGSRSQYNGTAWMTSDEVADIVNVLLLVQKDNSTKDHLYQTDKPNPAGTDTWDASRVKQELQNRGVTPFNSISSVSVSADFGKGITTGITFTGDEGTVNFSGSDFKNYFNLRAPASINIVGPLYNVERK